MPIRVVATIEIDPSEGDATDKYFNTTLPLLERVGARILEQFKVGDAVVGERLGETLMIVEYPNLEAVDAVFGSQEYRAIIPYRDKAFRKYNICIIGN